MGKKYSKSEIDNIVFLYNQGNSLKEVEKLTGVGSSTIRRYLKKLEIPMRHKGDHKNPRKFNKDIELYIIKLYVKENRTTKDIAQMLGTYNTSIRRVLLRNNIKLRSNSSIQRRVELSDIKSKEGTESFDYFIGLLATDGCITGNRIVLDFSEENKELLNYWNQFLGNKCNITSSMHKKYKVLQYRIAFRNQSIVNYLKEFGIISNKTFDLKLKYINWSVLRGIIDGDGCVSETNKGKTLRITITSGCENFLKQIKSFLLQENINSHIRQATSTTYELYIDKTFDIITIYNNLYKNAQFFLKRKKLKFGPLLKKFNNCTSVNSGKEMCYSNPEPSL